MTSAVYITGTDTGVGKTLVAASLLAALKTANIRAVGMKPVASGSDATARGLRNADAQLLIAHSAGDPDYALVNPYVFAEPVAPHLAAAQASIEIEIARVANAYASLATSASCVVVEGVGGWLAPLGPSLMQADLVHALGAQIILVVGLRLGCLNHALLSARAIQADGCRLAGWIGSCIDPTMLRLHDNLTTLRERLKAPCLGVLPHMHVPDPATLAAYLGPACDWLRR